MDAISHSISPVMLNPMDLQSMMQGSRISQEQKLQYTSSEFEATLIRQFLKEAMKPLIKGYLDEDGVAQDIYRGYFTDVMAQSLSEGKGIGISSVLQSQLSTNHQKTKETDAS
jgi:Rod binding domain-containing protein